MKWQVVLTKTAKALLLDLSKSDQQIVLKRLQKLALEPAIQGRPLAKELSGYRRVRTGRLRIIFRTDSKTATVYVVALGLRKSGDKADAYEKARKVRR